MENLNKEKIDSFKTLLNFVLANIVSADNNMTPGEVQTNLENLDKWQNDLSYRIDEGLLTEDDYKLYDGKMNDIKDILKKELEEFWKKN